MMPRAKMAESLANLIPTFSGKDNENIKFWLDQLIRIANFEKWNNEKKSIILRLHCRDKALQFLIDDPIASKENDFLILSELLIKKFEKKQTFQEIQKLFANISQKQNQSVKDLANDISIAADKYVSFDNNNPDGNAVLKENLKLTKFLEALKPDISLEVKKFGPKKFSEALAHAINIESALEQSCSSSNNAISNFDIHNILKENLRKDQIIADLNKKLNNITNHNVVNNINDKPSTSSFKTNVTCHICSKPHLTTDCWYFPKETQSNKPKHWQRGYSRGRYNNHPYRNNHGRFRRPRVPKRDLN